MRGDVRVDDLLVAQPMGFIARDLLEPVLGDFRRQWATG
jgi:hypothetical protein